MTPGVARIDVERLADELAAARPPLDGVRQRLAIALYRLLAEGRPVWTHRLAERAGVAAADVAPMLDRRLGVDLDERGAVESFWGLSLSVTPHRLDLDGRTLYAWCAWDTLFLPALLGTTIDVASPCPTSETPILLTVTPDQVQRLEPAGAVLSMRHPDERFTADTRSSFCRHVHFFASERAFSEWAARDAGTFAVTIDDGFEIARRVNVATYGPALPTVAETRVGSRDVRP
jgi:alkylmercury lyase